MTNGILGSKGLKIGLPLNSHLCYVQEISKTAFKITSKNLVEGLGTQNRNFHISALEKRVILFFSKHEMAYLF